ncbi:hypothetical protein XU18_2352 [Perkinsela sp. CCAP 1560/4]|nr:hypothetical protein XU18_2352 [Perkinsela sp. CCAP 1560/4]|eukprot:KNH06879.1 hypothetical protein XU18_2352 [Perkinsela sp. CCAP 1560/4]
MNVTGGGKGLDAVGIGKSSFWVCFGEHIRRDGFFQLANVYLSISSASRENAAVCVWDMVSQRAIQSSRLAEIQSSDQSLSHSWIHRRDLKVLRKYAPGRYRRCTILKPGGAAVLSPEMKSCCFFNSETLLFPFALDSFLATVRKIRIAHTHGISLRNKLELYKATESSVSRRSPYWISTCFLREMPKYNMMRCTRERPFALRVSSPGGVCHFVNVEQLTYSCFLSACVATGPMLNLATGHPFCIRDRIKLYDMYVARAFTSPLWFERGCLRVLKAVGITIHPHSRGVYVRSFKRVFLNACQTDYADQLMELYVEMRRRLSFYRNVMNRAVFSWRNAQAFYRFCIQSNYTSTLWVSHAQLGKLCMDGIRLRKTAKGVRLFRRDGRRRRVYSVMELEGYPQCVERLRHMGKCHNLESKQSAIFDTLASISLEEENTINQVLQLE